jgi:hypothetical protein
MRARSTTMAILALFCAPPPASGALVSQGIINVDATKPGGIYGYGGGGIAFVPGGTDSIAQDTLVINWAVNEGSNRNQVFQRITIPAGGGTPTVLATATLRWDLLYDGVNQYGNASGGDLVYDAANGKLVYSGTGTYASRFISFDLFDSDVTVSSVGYSAAHGDNTQRFGQTLALTPTGQYMTFYTYSSNLRKTTIAPTGMSGGAVTKTNIPVSSFTGWYPNSDGYPYLIDGYNCEGGVLYNDAYLLLRSFKNSANANKQETHIYQINSAFDAAAVNAYADLGEVQLISGMDSTSRCAWGLTGDPATGRAFVRYGYVNQPSVYARIQIVAGVPEPATLALLALGGLLTLRRRAR